MASVNGEIERLTQSSRLSSATDLGAAPNNSIPIISNWAMRLSRPRWPQGEVASEARTRSGEARPRKINCGLLPPNLERIEEVGVQQKACSCCGGALHQIGEDVAERLEVVPTTFRVLVTRRPRYRCRLCENAVDQAPGPGLFWAS